MTCAVAWRHAYRWVGVGIIALICVAKAAPIASADEPKQQTLNRTPDQTKDRLLTLNQADAYVEVRGTWDYTKVKRSGFRDSPKRRTQINREWGFQERIGLTLGGVYIDPHFITFQTDFSFGLAQDRFEERTDFTQRSDTDRGFLINYDARINFFQGRKISGSVYGLRRDDRINRRFQPTLTDQRTGFGTNWGWQHGDISLDLTYDFLRTNRRGNRQALDDEKFTENTLHIEFEWQVSDRQQLTVSYEHAINEQNFQGSQRSFETTRDLFIVEHELAFGDNGQHRLETRLRWQEESGDFARDIFEIGPQLTLKHSDALQTSYKYQLNRERFSGLDVDTQRLDFQLVHQLYSNLTTTVDVFGLYEDIENDINTTQYGASVDWQYNRRNPFGHLYVNLALAYDTEDVSGDNGTRVVINEVHTLRDPIDIILVQRNVVVGSIIVTDTSNVRIYRPGLDYIVFEQGNVMRITRIRTGRIVDGGTILVDYRFKTPANGSLDTVRVDFNVEQRFTGGFTPYYRLSYRNQEDSVSTGFARRADRTDHHRLGARYERERYTLGVEYEIYDDLVEPYDGFHLDALWHVMQGEDHTVDASSRFSRLLFNGGLNDRTVTLIDLEVDHRWRLRESLSTIERMTYRYERDSSRGITQGWDVTAGLEYAMGDLTSELTFEYDRLGLPQSVEDDFGVYFRMRRDIGRVFESDQ